MDFGDILAQYEKQQREENSRKKQKVPQVSHKKPNALTKEERAALKENASFQAMMEAQMERDNARRANPIDVWLNRFGTVDKDKIADQAATEARLNDREYLKSIRPEAVLDLHGLTRDEAWERMASFVSESKRKNLRKIMVIHGKGNLSNGSDPVLGPMVRMFIEQDSRLGASGHPDRNNGGNGATWILLK